MSFTGIFFRLFYEWASRGKSYDDLLAKLKSTGQVCHARLVNATEIGLNRSRAVHVIGIERWGTRRLRVALGEPLVMDEYDGYAPSETLSMEQLADEFAQTRAATLAVVRELKNKGVPLTKKVRHNEVGDLSVAGWIFYLDNHMWRETVVIVQSPTHQEKQSAKP